MDQWCSVSLVAKWIPPRKPECCSFQDVNRDEFYSNRETVRIHHVGWFVGAARGDDQGQVMIVNGGNTPAVSGITLAGITLRNGDAKQCGVDPSAEVALSPRSFLRSAGEANYRGPTMIV